MTEKTMKTGDVVRLKSGGPAMTVTSVTPSGDEAKGACVAVLWFDAYPGMMAQCQSAQFDMRCLDAVAEEGAAAKKTAK